MNKYAPILIPTLSRYEHFVKCVESLSKCICAEHTDIFIALDYPKDPKHKDGYYKILNYLQSSSVCNKFNSFNIIKREHNYGIGPNGNFNIALDDLFLKYDRIIASEDDNVFSPNFLLYMNKGLDLFENNNKIFAINGYRHSYNFKFSDNNYFAHNIDFSAWGYGIWRDKYKKMEKEINNGFFKFSFSINNIFKLYLSGLNRLFDYLSLVNSDYNGRSFWINDNLISCYLLISEKVVIMPSVTKVRNEGWDCTGRSFENGVPEEKRKIALRHMTQIIDDNEDFNYTGDPFSFFDYNKKVAVKQSEGRISILKFIQLIINSLIKKIKLSL